MALPSSHQALVYVISSTTAVDDIVAPLAATGAVTVMRADAWGIDTSRLLATEAYRTDAAGRLRHLVLVAVSMTHEAQNALLKILEEPPRGVVFHCCFVAGMALLPTVRSRLVPVTRTESPVDTALYDSLIRLPVAEQLAMVEERLKEKDIVWVEGVKQGALVRLRERVATLPSEASARLFTTLTRLNTRGASNKWLLEDLILTIATHTKNR